MNKVIIVLIVSFLAIFFINFVFPGNAFAINFGSKISEQTSMLLLGIVLIGVAGFGRKKFIKK
jgi:hypothetical protein